HRVERGGRFVLHPATNRLRNGHHRFVHFRPTEFLTDGRSVGSAVCHTRSSVGMGWACSTGGSTQPAARSTGMARRTGLGWLLRQQVSHGHDVDGREMTVQELALILVVSAEMSSEQ